jgi:hypothetical protein
MRIKTTIEELEAAVESLFHWYFDIYFHLLEGRKTEHVGGTLLWEDSGHFVPCDGGYCKLCKFNRSRAVKLHGSCESCCLAENGFYCEHIGSPWRNFIDDPTTENAWRMIQALQDTIDSLDITEG